LALPERDGHQLARRKGMDGGNIMVLKYIAKGVPNSTVSFGANCL
jgi:hypothetical protein